VDYRDREHLLELLEGVHTRCRFLIHAYRMEARRMRAHGVDPQRTEALQETVAIGTREFVAGVKRQLLGRDLSGVGGKRELRRRVALGDGPQGGRVNQGGP